MRLEDQLQLINLQSERHFPCSMLTSLYYKDLAVRFLFEKSNVYAFRFECVEVSRRFHTSYISSIITSSASTEINGSLRAVNWKEW